MKYSKIFVVIFVFAGALHSKLALAEDPDNKWSFKVQTDLGFLNDSNVSVVEIDTQSAEGDSAFVIYGKVGAEYKASEKTEVKLNASLRDKSFNDFSDFDLTTSLVSAQVGHDLGKLKLGLGTRFINTDLASQKFLTTNQFYGFASGFINKKLFARAQLTFADKDYGLNPDRDSSKDSLGADLYYFLDGTKKYWVFGYRYENEDADVDPQFSRDINVLKVRYSQKFPILARKSKLDLEARVQDRSHSSITPSIGEIRNDDRLRLSAELEVELTKSWFVKTEYEYSDYSSNLPSADFSQNVVSLKVGWRNEY